jgi:hypothetical protein
MLLRSGAMETISDESGEADGRGRLSLRLLSGRSYLLKHFLACWAFVVMLVPPFPAWRTFNLIQNSNHRLRVPIIQPNSLIVGQAD